MSDGQPVGPRPVEGEKMNGTPKQVAFALNNHCRHATETRPKYLGDLRIRDCDECLTENISAALNLAVGKSALEVEEWARILARLGGAIPNARL